MTRAERIARIVLALLALGVLFWASQHFSERVASSVTRHARRL